MTVTVSSVFSIKSPCLTQKERFFFKKRSLDSALNANMNLIMPKGLEKSQSLNIVTYVGLI